ncbi:MAG: 50S ribosomal protein L35 [Candidatus Pacebacteria bacterium]|jgi:ribosomal protein L35|nr:50S ribosomal protein L35 [Candidatus Paceibacterota bacterium]MDD3434354.1 hypothetical protein [Candidatus Paceibacterota bacterium]
MSRNLIQKRIKTTKTGKLLRRASHIGHNQAKKSRELKRSKKKPIVVHKTLKQSIIKIDH